MTPNEANEAQKVEPDENTAPPEPISASGAPRVVVVETEVEVADALATILTAEGYGVEIASDAKTALLLFHDFEPHLVLLGTYLADMPGYELTAILRGAPQYSWKFRHVGLLFVADRHKLLKHRFSGAPDIPIAQYIFKPVDPAEVRDKVARELAKVSS